MPPHTTTYIVFFIFQSSAASPPPSSSSLTPFVVASRHDSSSSLWDLIVKLQRGGLLVVASSHLRRHCLLSTRLARRLPGRLLQVSWVTIAAAEFRVEGARGEVEGARGRDKGALLNQTQHPNFKKLVEKKMKDKAEKTPKGRRKTERERSVSRREEKKKKWN